jgi:DNA-binding PadR family transcriptional regulator
MNDLLILALLLQGPKHGYALKKEATLLFGQQDMHNNLVYPLLRRFVNQRWVTRKKVAGDRGQTRQVYALTPLGRQAIVHRVRDFGVPEASSAEHFAIRVGLFEILSTDGRLAILDTRKAFLLQRAARFAPISESLVMGAYPRQVVNFLAKSIDRELAWIEKLRRIVNTSAPRTFANQRSGHS